MVKVWLVFLCFWWIGLETSSHATPIVDASIDVITSRAHFPIEGTLTVTHTKEEEVDVHSFQMEDKPLDVSFVKNVKMSSFSSTLVSIYSFQLPAQKKGLYVLPVVSVKIGGQTYRTVPMTYEVKEETSPPSVTSSNEPVIFRLEASVQGPTTLYPGERTKLLYRISYNRSVDLTQSVFPLIHPAHFQKIGDVQIQDKQQGAITIQELTQEVEAGDLGTFQLGPSSIEGYAYTMQAGQKVYDTLLLKAEAPAITLEVKPFPQLDQPPSFTGGLGKINVKASLESLATISVGDQVQVLVKIQGITNLAELHLPFIECQPGFSGFFQTSDFPPLAEVKENTKFFHLELRPLTALIQQIPVLEVSSFDPVMQKYLMQRTDPIPINVQAHSIDHLSLAMPVLLSKLPEVKAWPTPVLDPLKLKTAPVPVMQLPTFRWSAGWLFPISLALLLLLQKYLHDQWQKRSQVAKAKSEELLRRALKLENVHLLEQALRLRLREKGIDELPKEKKFDKLRAFLFQLQALQYSADKNFDADQLKQNAQRLFAQI